MKTWLIIAAILVLLGISLFIAALQANHWDFRNLSTTTYSTNTHNVNETFQNIALTTGTGSIEFLPSSDGSCTVVCYEPEYENHSVSVENGTLKITSTSHKKWYEHIDITFDAPKITVYLPDQAYTSLTLRASTANVESRHPFTFGDVQIRLSTGNIFLENLSAKNMALTVTTGKTTLENILCQGDLTATCSTGVSYFRGVNCENLTSSGNTGDLTMEKVIVSGKLSITRSTGDVEFTQCDAAQVQIETSTGDVDGNFLTPKIITTSTSTGEIEIPHSTTGNPCSITTSTGDIDIEKD